MSKRKATEILSCVNSQTASQLDVLAKKQNIVFRFVTCNLQGYSTITLLCSREKGFPSVFFQGGFNLQFSCCTFSNLNKSYVPLCNCTAGNKTAVEIFCLLYFRVDLGVKFVLVMKFRTCVCHM